MHTSTQRRVAPQWRISAIDERVMLHQTRGQRLIVNEVQSLEVLMVDEGQQRNVSRRIFAKVAGSGVAAAALAARGWHASAAPAPSSHRVTAYQDKPFAGK